MPGKFNDTTALPAERVPFEQIDWDDRYFKISRDRVDEGLRQSIRDFGVLDPPVAVREGGRYRVMFGFNRLDALRELGAGSAGMLIAPAADVKIFCERALVKCFRNETGPIGRVRALVILKDLGAGSDQLKRVAKQGMRVPEEFAAGGALSSAVTGLPGPVKEYCDYRDINFRTIRDLVRLPGVAVEAIASWLAFAPLRVNIFRFIVDMLSDIQTRDGSLAFVEGIRPGESDDRKKWDERLYEAVRGQRYPEYAGMQKKADAVAAFYAARGIRVEYPPYFEGDALDVTVRLHKHDDPESVRRRIEDADLSKLKELLELL